MRYFIACAVVWIVAASCVAQPVELGSGEHLANLVVNFKDGADYWFSVPFTPGETAEDAWLRADELSSLELSYDRYSFGIMIGGISYDGHGNSGYQGGEDWWHQWERSDADQTWASGWGVSSHTLTDGCWDALVYGAASPPELPEPGTMSLLAVGSWAAIAGRRRGRQGTAGKEGARQ